MRKSYAVTTAALILAALLLTSCVSVPGSVRGISPTPQQDLVRVMNAPQLYRGQEGRFGGRVVGVANQNGHTRLEIATMPLDKGARPIPGSATVGRIYAYVNGFIDPEDMRDRLITVVGTIDGTEQGKIGQTSWQFVVIRVTGYQRWHVVHEVLLPPPGYPGGWYGPGRWHHGYWQGGPWDGWYGPGPLPVQTILTE